MMLTFFPPLFYYFQEMIAVLDSSNDLTAIADAPTPAYGHPFPREGEFPRSFSAPSLRHGRRSLLPDPCCLLPKGALKRAAVSCNSFPVIASKRRDARSAINTIQAERSVVTDGRW